jgi:hypothetical protein
MSENALFDTAINDILTIIGVDVTYKGKVIKGDFIDYTRTLNLDTGDIEITGPEITVKNADCIGIKQGDSMIINSVTYKVSSFEKRGYGVTTVYLVRT